MNSTSAIDRRTVSCAILFACIVTVWTDRFTSFDHAKLALILAAVSGIGLRCWRKGILLSVPKEYLWIGSAFVGIGLLHVLIIDSPPHATTIFSHLARVLLLLTIVVLFLADVEEDARNSRVTTMLLIASVPVMFLAWVQYFEIAPGLFPAVPGYDQRIYSVFGNQNLLGGFIAISIPAALHHAIRAPRHRVLLLAYLGFASATCILTGSRTAWLAAILGIVAIIVPNRLNRTTSISLITVTTIGALMFAAFPEATVERMRQSFSDADEGWHLRLWIWAAAVDLTRTHGLLGLGPGGFTNASPEALGKVLNDPGGVLYHSNTIPTWYAHSTPLDLLLDYGLAGGILCVAWVVCLAQGRNSTLFGSAIAFSVYALFNSVIPSAPHVIAGLLIFACAKPYRAQHQIQINPFAMVSFAMILIAALACFLFTPDWQLSKARRTFADAPQNDYALQLYARATQNPFALPETHLEYAILVQPDDAELALAHLKSAARSLDTGEAHLMLSYTYEAKGDLSIALDHARLATYRWPRERSAWRQRIALEGENAWTLWAFEAKRSLSEEEWGSLAEELQLLDR